MATRQRGRGDLAAYYGELLGKQEESPLSVAEFAEEVGVSAATLYSWRRRLRRQKQAAKLVEVRVVDEERWSANCGCLAIEVRGRFRIELSADFDEIALRRVLGVLDRC